MASDGTPTPVAFTNYQADTLTYTVHSEAYYNQLAADAGKSRQKRQKKDNGIMTFVI